MDNTLANIIEQSAQSSPYYLSLAKVKTYELEGYEEFEVMLKLPNNGDFVCLNQAKVEMIKRKIQSAINDEMNNFPNTNYELAIFKGLNALKTAIESVLAGDCCPFSGSELKNMLFEEGFFGTPFTGICAGQTQYNETDYAKKEYDGDMLGAYIESKLGTMPGPYQLYITSNENICVDSMYQVAKLGYYEDEDDYDVWVHIYESQGENILFVNFEQYINGEDNTVFLPAARDGTQNRLNSSFLIYDPTQLKLYRANEVTTLNKESDEDDFDYRENGPIIYTVVTVNENIYGLIEMYENAFTYDDIINWNPSLSNIGPSLYLPMGTSITIYVTVDNEKGYYGSVLQGGRSFENTTFNNYVGSNFTGVSRRQIKESLFGIGMATSGVKALTLAPSLGVGTKTYISTEITKKLAQEAISSGALKESLDIATKEVVEKTLSQRFGQAVGPYVLKGGMLITFILDPVQTGTGAVPLTPGGLKKADLVGKGLSENLKLNFMKDPNSKCLNGPFYYITYTKTNLNFVHNGACQPLKQGRVYAGRSKGAASPCNILSQRDSRHNSTALRDEDDPKITSYAKARLDYAVEATPGTIRYADPAYWFNRGREDYLIFKNGGPLGYGSPTSNGIAPLTKTTRSRCKIYGIDSNGSLATYVGRDQDWFRRFSEYVISDAKGSILTFGLTPSVGWDGVEDIKCP